MNIYIVLAIIISIALLLVILSGIMYFVVYLQSSRIVKAYHQTFSTGFCLYIAYKNNVKNLVVEYEKLIRESVFFKNVERINLYELEEKKLREEFNTNFKRFMKYYNSSFGTVKNHYNDIFNILYNINITLTEIE